MSTLTLADARAHLNIDVDTYDAELRVFIDAAEAVVAKKCGPLASTAKTSLVDGGGSMLLLPVTPVVSLTSVTGNAGEVVSVSDLTVLPPGVVAYTSGGGSFPSQWYTVVYNAGRVTCPDDLLQAVKELLRHLWDTQRGGGVRPGSRPSEAASNTLAGAGYLLPFRVQELIAPHLQPGFA